jgi:hypothetical protein
MNTFSSIERPISNNNCTTQLPFHHWEHVQLELRPVDKSTSAFEMREFQYCFLAHTVPATMTSQIKYDLAVHHHH